MSRIIKVRCNGPERHVNDVDLDVVLRDDIVFRGASAKSSHQVPERLILPCRLCTGKVIVMREMIEKTR